MGIGRLGRTLALTWALAGSAAAAAGGPAQAASWRLDSSFGRGGVAGLPLREEGIASIYPPGPGDKGTLLAPGPQGSVFVGGYAESKRGSFLVARMSAQGRLVTSFGRGGVSVVPAIHSTPQEPPRMFAVTGERLLIVGLDRAGHLALVRLTAGGQADRSFGHDGVAQYTLPGARGRPLLAAVAIEADGDILAAYYQREVPQPANEPRIAPGLGEGALALVRLLPTGALDRSFGDGGFLTAAGEAASAQGFAAGVTIAPDGSVLIAYEQAAVAGSSGADVPAVQELGPAGTNASGFGNDGVALLPFTPMLSGESSVLFGGLFALPGGSVEVSFGGAGQLFRYTPTGALDNAFGASGHTSAGLASAALALAPDGEIFSVASAGKLTVAGTLASGAPDPALGGSRGKRFYADLAGRRPGEEQQELELLAADDTLEIIVGEELVRMTN